MRKIICLSENITAMASFLQALSDENKWDIQVEAQLDFDKKSGAEIYLMPVKGSWAHISSFPVHTQFTRQLQAADVIHREQDSWIPRLLVLDVFKKLLVDYAHDLDTRHAAYVIGKGECARVAAGFAAQLGYKHVFMVDEFEEANEENIQILTRLYWGVKFEGLLNSQLVLNATLGSLIINGDDLVEQKLLLQDISYFNFMSSHGFVLDAELNASDQLLYFEAQKAGLKSSSGFEMTYLYIQEVLRLLNLSWEIDKEAAVAKIKTFVQAQ